MFVGLAKTCLAEKKYSIWRKLSVVQLREILANRMRNLHLQTTIYFTTINAIH